MGIASSAVDLVEAIDIVDEISKHVKLKPVKQELLGLCPFHAEDTPSFYVNPSKQLYYCFGCQSGGNVINFRAKIAGLTNADAVEALAKDYHITLKGSGGTKTYQSVVSMAADFYQKSLKYAEDAKVYLEKRGLTKETIENFKIGYAPSRWNNLEKIKDFNIQDALKIGLLLKGEKGTYDRFRHRIVFPIVDHKGALVGFGGRALGDEKPKYINSSDSDLYHKSEVLYGLHQALKSHQKRLIVVEGYLDVIALHQAGIPGAVAALGTAFTIEHFQLMAKYAEEIVFCFDGDTAGKSAAQKAFYTILPQLRDQVSCYFLWLPEDEDPDSYIQKKGKVEFEALLAKAIPLSTYLLEHIVPSKENSIEKRAKRLHQLKEIIALMPESILKQLIEKELGVLPVRKKTAVKSGLQKKGGRLIGLIFGFPELIRNNEAVLSPILVQLPKVIQDAIEVVLSNETVSLASFLLKHNLSDSGMSQVHYSDLQLVAQEIGDLLMYYRLSILERRIKTLMQELMDEENKVLLQQLLQAKHMLKTKKITLAVD